MSVAITKSLRCDVRHKQSVDSSGMTHSLLIIIDTRSHIIDEWMYQHCARLGRNVFVCLCVCVCVCVTHRILLFLLSLLFCLSDQLILNLQGDLIILALAEVPTGWSALTCTRLRDLDNMKTLMTETCTTFTSIKFVRHSINVNLVIFVFMWVRLWMRRRSWNSNRKSLVKSLQSNNSMKHFLIRQSDKLSRL